MSDLTPKELALLDTVRAEWGPDDVAPPTPEALGARLAEKPWLRGPPAPSRFGRFASMAIVALGVCTVGYFTLRGSAPPRAHDPAEAASVAPASGERVVGPAPAAPSSVTPPIAETMTIESLPDAPRGSSGEARVGPKVAERAPDRPRTPPPSSTAPAGATTAAEADTLADELALIRSAQGALRGGSADRALTILASHASQFPRGVLREERMTLQALALCARGDVAAARAVRAELARSSPGSSHLQRLANSCAAGDP